MAYKILTNDTFKVISCSNNHCADDPASRNLHAEVVFPPSPMILLRHDNADGV